MAREETADLLRSSRRKFSKILFSAENPARFHPARGRESIRRPHGKTRIEFLRNFRRDVPLQGLTARAGGRLKRDIETGIVSSNRSRRQTILAIRSSMQKTASTSNADTRPAQCPRRRSLPSGASERAAPLPHLSGDVGATAVSASPADQAVISREAGRHRHRPGDLRRSCPPSGVGATTVSLADTRLSRSVDPEQSGPAPVHSVRLTRRPDFRDAPANAAAIFIMKALLKRPRAFASGSMYQECSAIS